MSLPIWQPSSNLINRSNITRFINTVNQRLNLKLTNYQSLWQWSVENPSLFWFEMWQFAELKAQTLGERVYVPHTQFHLAQFFPDARISFAENYLKRRDDATAITFWGEDQIKLHYSFKQLYEQVSQLAQALRAEGVEKGDVVAAYLPNLPHTLITLLAANSLGAIFTSASPDFGVQGILDRFGQVKPKVLISCDAYIYNHKRHNVLDKIQDIVCALPSLQKTIIVHYAGDLQIAAIANATTFDDFIRPFTPTDIDFDYVEFDHPVYILYSSGTTGVPKAIIHRTGGVLLKHASELMLHADVQKNDCMCYFTTCGWMMWNWSISTLLCGASLALYDGSPFLNEGYIQFEYLQTAQCTHFGTSPKFLEAAAKASVSPRLHHDLSALRVMMCSGSPLAADSYEYVYQHISPTVHLNAISGGTDLVGIFMGGAITEPVYRGEMQVPAIGMRVEIFDDDGHAVAPETRGELVCTLPFPTMPVGFLNDDDQQSKFKEAYFDTYPNTWHHGDYAAYTAHGGLVIYGRSDTTLNPGGVRIGTAEIYRQVDTVHEVLESCVIAQAWPPEKKDDVRIVLFVKLRHGLTLDSTLTAKIKQAIRDNTTPRHVPAKVIQVVDIPRTKSGKIVETAVRKVIHGEEVKNKTALEDANVLLEYQQHALMLWQS